MSTPLRRLILCTVICSVSAAPSFVLASGEYDRGAMLVGIALFIAIYTAATSTDAFERFRRRPFVRRTLYIGYGLRLMLSVIFALGMSVVTEAGILLAVDIWPGILSVQLVKGLGIELATFHGTLLTTIVQGAMLNAIIFVVMAVSYSFQRLFMTPPPEFAPKGFDVVMPSVPP